MAKESRGPIRVLVVDDEKPLQELLKASLEAFGLHIAGIANNGQECLDEYEKLKPDAVVMDIRMPVMDGITALTKLKEAHPESVVLMITANQEEAQRQEALKIGANGFLHKPFRVDELFQDIQRAFRSVLARKTEEPLDDQYVRYVLNQGPVVQAAMRPSMPQAVAAAAAAAAASPSAADVQFLDSGSSPAPSPGAPETEIAQLKRENRELREQLQSARDTAERLLETLQKALKPRR